MSYSNWGAILLNDPLSTLAASEGRDITDVHPRAAETTDKLVIKQTASVYMIFAKHFTHCPRKRPVHDAYPSLPASACFSMRQPH
jgi:hypothetical protein